MFAKVNEGLKEHLFMFVSSGISLSKESILLYTFHLHKYFLLEELYWNMKRGLKRSKECSLNLWPQRFHRYHVWFQELFNKYWLEAITKVILLLKKQYLSQNCLINYTVRYFITKKSKNQTALPFVLWPCRLDWSG